MLAATTPQPRHGFWRNLYDLISPYWRQDEKFKAWGLLLAVLALNFAIIYGSVLMNHWNGRFFDMLQHLDRNMLMPLILQFSYLVIFLIVLSMARAYLTSYLGLRWRLWLTRRSLGNWLRDNTFFQLFLRDIHSDNPDQRITDDLNAFTTTTLDLFIGMISSLVNGITFAFLLWSLAHSLSLAFSLFGYPIVIKGYMLWLAVVYAVIATGIVFKVAKPLIQLDYTRERVEANFRFSLMRIREYREQVALARGGPAEELLLEHNLHAIKHNFMQILRRNLYVNCYLSFFNSADTLIPYLAAAPQFFTGAITLGVLSRLSIAFTNVINSCLFFAFSVQQIAAWRASFNRIQNLNSSIDFVQENLKPSQDFELTFDDSQTLRIEQVKLFVPNQQRPLTEVDFTMQAGDKVMLMGDSGLGKSTLIKAIAGEWPYASGHIVRPRDILFVPQKPYFPINTLRSTLLYPHLQRSVDDQELKQALQDCCLSQLVEHLDSVNDWNATLSLGEQQRLNFVRILVNKPSWLVMDEPTSAMDKNLESHMLKLVLQQLPQLSLLTVAHEPSLESLHDRVIQLTRYKNIL